VSQLIFISNRISAKVIRYASSELASRLAAFFGPLHVQNRNQTKRARAPVGLLTKKQQEVGAACGISSTHEGTGINFMHFRTADLGQQYDTVSHVGGNFSFYIDTFILRCITLGVVCSLSSQVGLPWFIPSRGILLCVGLHPALFLVLHCAGLFPATLYTCLIVTGFLGARRVQHEG
jgi:hypothetical protein